jgi:hypothetical protein
MFMMRWKAIVRQAYVWAFVVLAMLASLIPASSGRYRSESQFPIGLVNEDQGQGSLDLETYLDGYDKLLIFDLDREKALRYLAMGRLECVYIVEDGFTECVRNDVYEGIITLYTAPGSSAAVLLSETIINSALLVWMVETALYKVDGFLQSEGIPFTGEMRREMHDEFNEMLHNGSLITVREYIPSPARTGGTHDALLAAAGWYAALVALFVITGAGWVIETKRRALGERMLVSGFQPAAVLTGSSLAVIGVSMLGWLGADVLSAAVAGFSAAAGLSVALPMLLYMAGIMGLTLTFASALERSIHLMLLAPLFTITQGVICGMLVELPNWAGFFILCFLCIPRTALYVGRRRASEPGESCLPAEPRRLFSCLAGTGVSDRAGEGAQIGAGRRMSERQQGETVTALPAAACKAVTIMDEFICR